MRESKVLKWEDPDKDNLSRKLNLPRQARVMCSLVDELTLDKPYTTKEAADELGEYMSSVANSLRRLHSQGLVSRKADRSRSDCRLSFIWQIDSKAVQKRLESLKL